MLDYVIIHGNISIYTHIKTLITSYYSSTTFQNKSYEVKSQSSLVCSWRIVEVNISASIHWPFDVFLFRTVHSVNWPIYSISWPIYWLDDLVCSI